MGTLNTDLILMRKTTKTHLPRAFLSEKPEGLVRCLSFYGPKTGSKIWNSVESVNGDFSFF
jgi:hypothetical protein